ncbi:MAG: CarD family transcriptional regulator [Lachnospiraceae bacterium]|nr:CarD family transcriptional regulator [Lachnospiraceae bacterium]
MYEIGDYVVSANEGVCKVTDIVTMAMPGRRDGKKCYVIIPEGQKGGKLYIPVDSDKHQVRPIMTKEEVDTLLEEMAAIEETWIESDKMREQIYKEAIFSCDPRRLVSILRTMYLRGNKRAAEGKKVTTVDERYFRIAEKNLHSELAFVLGISMDEVMELIKKKYKQAGMI